MLAIFVCLLQVTLIGAASSALAAWFMTRAPSLSARLGWLGIALSSMTVLAALIDLPRPWTIREPAALAPVFSTRIPEVRVSAHGRPATETPPALTWTLPQLVSGLGQLRREQPGLERDLIVGCSILAWLAGGLFAMRGVLGTLALWQLRATSTLNEDPRLQRQVDQLSERTKVKVCRIYSSSRIHMPCVSWLCPGAIYVPSGFDRWSWSECRAALAHEMAHESRWDAQMRFAADLLLPWVSFHPWMRLLRRQLVLGQELAADQRAAEMLGSVPEYQRGLSMLALRMDSQCDASFSFGVSVSTNNVVRRIKMLSLKMPAVRRWQEMVVASLLLAMGAMTVAWTAKADDTVRVASRTKPVPASRMFVRSPTAPWQTLGAQHGYLAVRPNAILPHFSKEIYDAFLGEVFNTEEVQLEDYGIDGRNVSLITANLTGSVKRIAEEDLDESGQKFNGYAQANAMTLDSQTPIDWPRLAKECFSGFEEGAEPEVATRWLRESMISQGVSKHMSILSKNTGVEESPLVQDVQTTFKTIDGGVIACAMVVPRAELKDLEPEIGVEHDPFGFLPALKMVKCLGVGIDMQDASQQHVKVALMPADGVSAGEVVALFEGCCRRAAGALQALAVVGSSTLEPREQATLAQIIDDIQAAQFQALPADSEGPSLVLWHLKMNVDTGQYLSSLLN